MGPATDERTESKQPVIERTKVAVAKAAKKYFERPCHYLFYGMLTATAIGSFFGMAFPLTYYGILVILLSIKLWDHFHAKQ